MIFNPALSIWLNRVEEELIKKLNQGEVPFLGGYLDFLDDKSKKYFQAALGKELKPGRFIFSGLKKWPAVFAAYLTEFVVEGYGSDKHAAVWPYLDMAIGKNDYVREDLWKAYRAACIKIGLPVLSRKSGNLYMVNEFLNQAGVPISSIDKLAERMVRYTRSHGLPQKNDTQSVTLWRTGLLQRIGTIQKPVIRALETDDTDYYPLLFIQFYEQDEIEPFNCLEEKFFNKLEQLKNSKLNTPVRTFLVPIVVWRNNQVCIEIPAGIADEWIIETNETKSSHLGLLDTQVIGLNTDLPYRVEVKNEKTKESWGFSLWEGLENNRFLLFDTNGNLVKSGCLKDSIYHLEPGTYQAVSRFIPNGFDESDIETISYSPDIHSFSFGLLPGEKTELAKGPASVSLQADTKPLISWSGSNIQGVRGKELFASEGLSIQLKIPDELLESNEEFIIRFTPDDILGDTYELPIDFTQSNDINISLESICEQWNAGLARVSATLLRQGTKRTLVRGSIYLWNGLKGIDSPHIFEFTKKPKNISEESSDNIKIDNFHLTYKDNSNRFFRSVFDLDITNKKQVSFTWAVPGTFIDLEQLNENGEITEKALAKGSLISVKEGSRSALKLYSDISGKLQFGSFSQWYDFSHSRYKRISLLSLISYITPDDDTLYFLADGCNEPEVISRITSPQYVLAFATEQHDDNYQIIFSLAETAEEIEFHALNLINGKEITERLIANNPSDILSANSLLWFSNEQSQQNNKHTLNILLRNLTPGAWLFNFKIRVGRQWRNLSNPRGDTYSAGFVLSQGYLVSIGAFTSLINESKESDLLASVKRVYTSLQYCYSNESWHEIKWVKSLWNTLSRRLRIDSKQTLIELLRLSTTHPIDTGWIPLHSINSSFLEIYTLPKERYQNLSNENHLTLQCLNLINLFSNDLTQLFMKGLLYPTAASGFSNFHNMMRGDQPQYFSIKDYNEALLLEDLSKRIRLLHQEDWHPGEGYYLGALHYLYSVEKLKENYQLTVGLIETDVNMGNKWRRGNALRLMKKLINFQLSYFADEVPAHWDNNMVTQNLSLLSKETEDAENQEIENLELIVSGLSLLAQVCRWNCRSIGALDRFKEKSKQLIGVNSEELELIFGYILFIGEDIFAFYLLLWEFVTVAHENETNPID